MIKITDLVMKYGENTVLSDINLEIGEESSCAIIGPSGCGKSTLLYGLAGIVKPARGKVKIFNEVVKENRKKTGLILQNYGLLPWKTVWDNAALGLKLRSVEKDVIVAKVTTILKRLGIYKLRDKYPVQLSGGQQQRVAIARVLSIEPDLLLMDEPFSSLDAITRESLQNLILEIFNNNKMSIVLVTHNIEEAVFLGQKIIIMDKAQGHINQIVHNDNFGDESLRDKEEYYQTCSNVRRLMKVNAGIC